MDILEEPLSCSPQSLQGGVRNECRGMGRKVEKKFCGEKRIWQLLHRVAGCVLIKRSSESFPRAGINCQ